MPDQQLTFPMVYPERFEAFLEFHRLNPWVWAWFKYLAGVKLRAGKKCSARSIGEFIRWQVDLPIVKPERENLPHLPDDPKINDHHWPYYSRLLMATDKRFEGFFETRDAKFDIDVRTLVKEAVNHELDESHE